MTAPTDGPGLAYTIRVSGRMEARWTAWFDGFTVTGEDDGTTSLAGRVADQAQLHRLLTRIRDLGIVLVSLESRPPGEGTGRRPGHGGQR